MHTLYGALRMPHAPLIDVLAAVPGQWIGLRGGPTQPPKTHAEAAAYAEALIIIAVFLLLIVGIAIVADRMLATRSERRLIRAVLAGRRRRASRG